MDLQREEVLLLFVNLRNRFFELSQFGVAVVLLFFFERLAIVLVRTVELFAVFEGLGRVDESGVVNNIILFNDNSISDQ